MDGRQPVFFSLVMEHIHSASLQAKCSVRSLNIHYLLARHTKTHTQTHTHANRVKQMWWLESWAVGFYSLCSPTVTVTVQRATARFPVIALVHVCADQCVYMDLTDCVGVYMPSCLCTRWLHVLGNKGIMHWSEQAVFIALCMFEINEQRHLTAQRGTCTSELVFSLLLW